MLLSIEQDTELIGPELAQEIMGRGQSLSKRRLLSSRLERFHREKQIAVVLRRSSIVRFFLILDSCPIERKVPLSDCLASQIWRAAGIWAASSTCFFLESQLFSRGDFSIACSGISKHAYDASVRH